MSSYNEYIKEAFAINKDYQLGMFSDDKAKAIELFCKFNYQKNNDMCLEDEDKIRVSDSELKERLAKLGIMNASEFRQFEKGKRNEFIRKLKSIEEVTTRQLSRVTGISKSVIISIWDKVPVPMSLSPCPCAKCWDIIVKRNCWAKICIGRSTIPPKWLPVPY